MGYEYRNKRIIKNFARRYTTNVSDEVDILFELDHVYAQAPKADEYEAKAKAFDEIKECLHSAQSSIDRSENRKEERDYAVAFFNELVEMDILEVYERTERND